MIGVAGCGRLGLPILTGLREAGADAGGFDTAPKPQEWITQDAAAFVRDLRTLFVVVSDRTALDDVLFGAQNFVGRAMDLHRLVVMTDTSGPHIKSIGEKLPDRIQLVDAAVTGSISDAENRRLSFYLGGDPDDIEDVLPLLATVGDNFHKMGTLGSGMQVKHMHALYDAAQIAVTRLVLDWGQTSGLDDPAVRDIIATGTSRDAAQDLIDAAVQGHAPDNTVGLMVRNVAEAIQGAPKSADVLFPQILLNMLRNMPPRNE